MADLQVRTALPPRPLVLVDTRSSTERALIDEWIALRHPDAEVVEADPANLRRFLDAPQRVVIPVRVGWSPPPDRNGRAPRLSDVVALPVQRKPWGPLHSTMLRRRPDAAQVIEGEPATCAQLRAAHAEQLGAESNFGDFVVRQAVLSCERAERRLIGDRYKVPRMMVDQIFSSAQFQQRALALAQRLDLPPDEVLERARTCLHEMVAVQSPPAIDAFRAMMNRFHSRAFDWDIDSESLERLRALNREQPLVFLPCHKSYVDPLIMAEVLHRHDFPRQHLLGGANLSFWPIGPVGKRAGVVFIRRSFGEDQVYKFALREYLGELLAKRFNMEWYIEGGRTRTGKLRPPKFGLLRYLVDALEDRPEHDAILVPVSIVYDQLHEVGSMAAEQAGAVKKAEGLGWLARYLKDQRKHIGAVRIRFDEPFSLREALAEFGESGAALEKVAFKVCTGINRVSTVTATSLVTFALLGVGDRALTFSQVQRVTDPLLDLLESRGVPAQVEQLRTEEGMRATLDRLVEEGVAERFDGGRETVWSIPTFRAHVAAFYRNGALHHLVNRAIVELAVVQVIEADEPGDVMSQGRRVALRLRDLLKFEFFFASKQEFVDELIAEADRIDATWQLHARNRDVDAGVAMLRAFRVLVAPRTVRSIFESQLVVALQLTRWPAEKPLDEAAFLDECLGVGRQLLLQGRIASADSVSRELYSSALRLAENRSLTAPRPGVGPRRRVFLTEVKWALRLVAHTAQREAALVQEVLDDVT